MPTESFQKVFNTGILTVVPSGANPTPVQIATLKDISLDISYNLKELRGSNVFAEDMAVSDGKISGKAKSGRIFGGLLAAVMQGITSNTGQVVGIDDERQTIPSSSPYTLAVASGVGDTSLTTNGAFSADSGWTKGTGWAIAGGKATFTGQASATLSQSQACSQGQSYLVVFTLSSVTSGNLTAKIGNQSGTVRASSGTFSEVIVCGAGTDPKLVLSASSDFSGSITNVAVYPAGAFLQNQGVFDVTTGMSLQCVSGVPTTGQYAVDPTTGTYTFASADQGHVISFRYTYTSTSGLTYSLLNSLMGANTKFQLHAYNTYDGANSGWKLYATMFPKLGIAYKPGDYAETDLDFTACADSAGRVIDFYKA